MKLGPRRIRAERASRSDANGRICLKERTYFLHPPGVRANSGRVIVDPSPIRLQVARSLRAWRDAPARVPP
jgi:hypothetical protein